MIDRWFSALKLPLSRRQFHRLPRNPAYKYEYLDRAAWLSPRPRIYGARLILRPPVGGIPSAIEVHRGGARFRRLEDRDWPRLSRLFAGSFHRVQPFAGLSDRRRLEAARACLKGTREGLDGPIVRPACHLAVDAKDGRPIGDCIERRLGHAHLTWIFVAHRFAGYGVGSGLLAHASIGLLELGYTELISSFLLGNESSMLWHWRNGFELLPYAGSKRRFRELMRVQEAGTGDEPRTLPTGDAP
jgi:hypothetical protein